MAAEYRMKFFSAESGKIPAFMGLERLDMISGLQNIENEGVVGKILRNKELEPSVGTNILVGGRQIDWLSRDFARTRQVWSFLNSQ